MSYEIRLTNGTILATVDDGTLDTDTTSISLVGRRYADYGQTLNQNSVSLLENFSNSIPPENPLNGQIWFDSSTNAQALKVYVNDTIGWRALGFTNLLQESDITDNVIFSGTARFSNTTTFEEVATFTDTAIFSDISFNTGTISGDVTSSATIIQDGTTTFNGGVTFAGTVSYPGTVAFDNAVTFANNTDFLGDANVLGDVIAETRVVAFTNMEATGYLSTEGTINITASADKAAIFAKKDIGNDLSTVLFLDCNGAEGATSITDTSAGTTSNGGVAPDNTITLTNATVDTYRGRISSSGTLNFNGSSAYASITDNINYDFSTNEFSMDGWFFTESASTEQVIMAKGTSASLRWEVFINGSNQLAFEYSDGVDTISMAGGSVDTFTWTHWALERETSGLNAVFTLYLNGNRVAQTTVTSANYDFDDITANVEVGRRSYAGFNYFAGNMDDIRIKKTGTSFNGGFKPRTTPVSDDGVIAFTNVAGQSYILEFRKESY